MIPTRLDLDHAAFWITAVLAVAVILGALYALVDFFFSYGFPESDTQPEDPIVTIRVPRSFSQPASKGYHRPTVVPFNRSAVRRG